MAIAKNIEGKMADGVEDATAYVPGIGTVTVFSAPWCGDCTRIKQHLRRAGVDYTEVNIDQDPIAEKVAAQVNGGSWVIPTLVFSDGQVLVNPGINRVQEILADID